MGGGLLAAAAAAVSSDIVDAVTAEKIREIVALKDAAVHREDYDEAKRLRDSINRLKALGNKVASLEARKRSAVEAEDYDLAKIIKAEIEALRLGTLTCVSCFFLKIIAYIV